MDPWPGPSSSTATCHDPYQHVPCPIAIWPHLLHLHPDWLLSAEEREAALARRNTQLLTRYNASSKRLYTLRVGDSVPCRTRVPTTRGDRTAQAPWWRYSCTASTHTPLRFRLRHHKQPPLPPSHPRPSSTLTRGLPHDSWS